MSLLVRQRPAHTLDGVADQLREAFLAVRQAVEDGTSVALVVDAPDLLGQGTVEDAAVATGLLGLMRAVTFEGGSKGWHVNLIAVERGDDAPADVVDFLGLTASVSGQVLNLSSCLVGKVIP